MKGKRLKEAWLEPSNRPGDDEGRRLTLGPGHGKTGGPDEGFHRAVGRGGWAYRERAPSLNPGA